MSKLRVLFILVALAACGEKNRSQGPDTNSPGDPASSQPIRPAQIDIVPPRVTGYRQIGLDKLIIEFSEPIKLMDRITYGQGIEDLTWDPERRVLTADLDVTKIEKYLEPEIRLIRFLDDANLQNREEAIILIDVEGPALDGIKIVDAKSVLVTFSEDTWLSETSEVTLDAVVKGRIATVRPDQKQALIEFTDSDLVDGQSHQLTISNSTDIYGNVTKESGLGFAQGLDIEPPKIVSIRQLPTKYHNLPEKNSGRMLGFELEFSEFVLDYRDFGTNPNTQLEKAYPLRSLIINGRHISSVKGSWKSRDDHRGGTLLLSAHDSGLNFHNGQLNSIEIVLMDALGNSHYAKAEMIVDSSAPTFLGDYDRSTLCAMSGMQSFRCEVSEPDIQIAALAPENIWPKDDYTVRITTEESEGRQRHWLNFDFKKNVPENPLTAISIIDHQGNSNFDKDFDWFFFRPSTIAAELKGATAFSGRILELEFTKDVGSVDALLVNGLPKEFDLSFVDNGLEPFTPPTAVLHFKEPIAEGVYDIELKGIGRARNELARTESAKLQALDNRRQSILQSSITQKPDLMRTTDLRFEVTRPLETSIEAFAGFHEASGTRFTDFTLTPEGLTARGTYSIRLHKETASGLTQSATDQGIMLMLPGEPLTRPMPIDWSTREPSLIVTENARPDGFKVKTYSDVDLDSLELEIVGGDEIISVRRSWIRSYETSPNDFGFIVTLPDIRLKTGPFIYKLRVKGARTKGFGISLSTPYDIYLDVK